MPDPNSKIRLAVFDWLSQQTTIYGDVLPRSILSQGFKYKGTRVPLLGPQGIFKPRIIQKFRLVLQPPLKGRTTTALRQMVC